MKIDLRQLFQRNVGCWLIWVSSIYLVVGISLVVLGAEIMLSYWAFLYTVFLSLPIVLPSLAKFLNFKSPFFK
jgi:hypothetical protein